MRLWLKVFTRAFYLLCYLWQFSYQSSQRLVLIIKMKNSISFQGAKEFCWEPDLAHRIVFANRLVESIIGKHLSYFLSLSKTHSIISARIPAWSNKNICSLKKHVFAGQLCGMDGYSYVTGTFLPSAKYLPCKEQVLHFNIIITSSLSYNIKTLLS